MKVRSCWSALENKAEQLLNQLQSETGQALKLHDSLLSSRQRLDKMLQEYRDQSTGPSNSTGMSDALNQRQFMTRLVVLRERVVQDLARSSHQLAGLKQRTRLAQEERLKMQVLMETDLKAVRKHVQSREQSQLDELGVMQFNRASAV
ncbi:MAG: flagellar export protein FliJ [Burkholderiaceae bacterium]